MEDYSGSELEAEKLAKHSLAQSTALLFFNSACLPNSFFSPEVFDVFLFFFSEAAVSWLLWPMTPEEFFRECETQERRKKWNTKQF